MENIKKFILSLQFIFMPRYWVMNYGYNKIQDAQLNALMDKYEFTKCDVSWMNEYYVKIGESYVRIANYPYAVWLCPYENTRPSRLTILRMENKIAKDLSKQITL
jgi:hypothetical protein